MEHIIMTSAITVLAATVDTADQINQIPIDNIQAPQKSIVGPTLEASKYYIDGEEHTIDYGHLNVPLKPFNLIRLLD